MFCLVFVSDDIQQDTASCVAFFISRLADRCDRRCRQRLLLLLIEDLRGQFFVPGFCFLRILQQGKDMIQRGVLYTDFNRK